MTEKNFILNMKKQIKNFAAKDRDALFYQIRKYRRERLDFELKELSREAWQGFLKLSDEEADLIEKGVKELREVCAQQEKGAAFEEETPF
jgi:hypothetical protein